MKPIARDPRGRFARTDRVEPDQMDLPEPTQYDDINFPVMEPREPPPGWDDNVYGVDDPDGWDHDPDGWDCERAQARYERALFRD